MPELEARAARRDARALRELAYRALQNGDPDRARSRLDEAFALEPESSDAYNLRGMLHAGSGRPAEAAAAFRRAAQLAPERAGPRLNLGRLYLQENQFQAAAAAFQDALAADPKSEEAARLAGDAWRLARSSVTAKKYYREALALKPDDPKAHAGLGEVFTNSGRLAEARDHLERARALGDGSPRTEGYLGLALALGAGSPEEASEALKHLESARAAGESESHLYLGLGLANLARHDLASAQRTLREGVKRFPDVAGLYYTLADVYAASGRTAESRAAREKSAKLAELREREEKLLEAIATHPAEKGYLLQYSRWLFQRSDYDRAVPVLRQALRLDPANAEARAGLERAARALRRPTLLKDALREVEERG